MIPLLTPVTDVPAIQIVEQRESASFTELMLQRLQPLPQESALANSHQVKAQPSINVHVVESWRTSFDRNVQALRELKRGWDGPSSMAVDPAVLNYADQLLKDALVGASGAKAPYVVPIRDGSIQLEWHMPAYELEVVLSSGQPVYAWLRDRDSGNEIEGDGDKAIDIVLRWARRVATPVLDGRAKSHAPAQAPVLLAA